MEVEYDYEAELQDELTIQSGDILTSVKQMSGGWWEGVLKGKRGLFPENFVKVRAYKLLSYHSKTFCLIPGGNMYCVTWHLSVSTGVKDRWCNAAPTHVRKARYR